MKPLTVSKKNTSLEKASKNWESKEGSPSIKKIGAKGKWMPLHRCGIKTQIELAGKDKEGHCTLITEAVHQNTLTI